MTGKWDFDSDECIAWKTHLKPALHGGVHTAEHGPSRFTTRDSCLEGLSTWYVIAARNHSLPSSGSIIANRAHHYCAACVALTICLACASKFRVLRRIDRLLSWRLLLSFQTCSVRSSLTSFGLINGPSSERAVHVRMACPHVWGISLVSMQWSTSFGHTPQTACMQPRGSNQRLVKVVRANISSLFL